MFQKTEELRAALHDLGVSVWTLAALAALFESGLVEHLTEPRSIDQLAPRCAGLSRAQLERCLEVAAEAGVLERDAGSYRLCAAALPLARQPWRTGLQGELLTTLLQGLALVDAAKGAAPRHGWCHTDPAVLQAQGDASAQLAAALKAMIVPQLGDLGARLERAGARFLDVGVGVASLALAMCRAFPALQVVGLDVYEPALALARDNVARAELGARIELRNCPVQELREERAFDLAWLPSFFIPSAELDAGIARVQAALRPGGWLVFAATGTHAGSSGATRALSTELWGGASLGTEPARALLERAGFSVVRVLPGPPWAPTTLAAQVSG